MAFRILLEVRSQQRDDETCVVQCLLSTSINLTDLEQLRERERNGCPAGVVAEKAKSLPIGRTMPARNAETVFLFSNRLCCLTEEEPINVHY